MKVGDTVAVVELRSTLVDTTTIVRETPTMWVVATGSMFRKRDGARHPRYLDTNRRIMSLEDYERARAAR